MTQCEYICKHGKGERCANGTAIGDYCMTHYHIVKRKIKSDALKKKKLKEVKNDKNITRT